MLYIAAAVALLSVAVGRAEPSADASRGQRFLDSQQCFTCHRLDNGWKKGVLARLRRSRMTPPRLAGTIWNHAPLIWGALQEANLPVAAISYEQASDVILYFAAAGYYEPGGDPVRGAKVIEKQGCANCHSVEGMTGIGPPVAAWTSGNPIDLMLSMWKHSSHMRAALEQKKLKWPSLSNGELRDILAYVLPLAKQPSQVPEMQIGEAGRGKELFSKRGCVNCHKGSMVTEFAVYEHTLTELAAVLWNHAPMMLYAPPDLTRQEMSDLVAYLWSVRYFEETGNAVRGKAIFLKSCQDCHSSRPAGGKADSAVILASVWKHASAEQKLRSKGGVWPRLAGNDVADLIAFLNAPTK
jgi:mono/diheme cytochrome c family protein